MVVSEADFREFRENTIGYHQSFQTCCGNKELVYADWAASGRLYRPIEDILVNKVGPYIGNTHSYTSITGKAMSLAYKQARKVIKEHVKCSEKDILFMTGYGTTSAVNKLQRLLGLKLNDKYKKYIKLPVSKRPVVFITHMEHHSNYLSWIECDVDVVILPNHRFDVVDLDRFAFLLKKYQDREVKIGAFTAGSNVTGVQPPYREMAKLIHEFGGYCFVDFAAAAPYCEIQMNTTDPLEKLDGIYFSPHKFLGGPGTSGILIVDSKLCINSVPDRPGGGTVNWTNPWGQRGYISNIEDREDGGTPGILQAIKTSLCLELKNKMNMDRMRMREKHLIDILFSELSLIDGLIILDGDKMDRLGIFSFYIENIHYNLIVKLLNDRFGIQVRGGCSCAGVYGHYLFNISKEESRKITKLIDRGNLSKKPGWVRISIHPIMTDSEIYYICDSIKSIVKNINNWALDYHYNARTNEFENIKEIQLTDKIYSWFTI